MEIVDELIIDAPLAAVWALTIDVVSWPTVTPTVTSVERLDDGPISVGSRARLKQPRQMPAIWTVTRCEAESLFEWSTRTLGMTMVGSHRLSAVDGDRCRNVLTLSATGVPATLFGWALKGQLHTAIATENASFKRRAESTA